MGRSTAARRRSCEGADPRRALHPTKRSLQAAGRAWNARLVTSPRIPLEGAYNFRDLGGLAGHGGRRIRKRRVFRSDRLTNLTPSDAEMLESFSIGRVFDLRSDLELEHHGAGSFAAAADRHRHTPLVRVSLSITDSRIDWQKVDLQSRYLEMLHEGAPVIREILEHLAREDARATVFHCTGGKDRTGVMAAVLLRTLGVDDDVIVDDYAISERYLAPFVEATRTLMEREGFDNEIVLYLCGSPAERMRKMLTDMDAKWGSVDAYLEWIGMRASTVDSLRRRLLVEREIEAAAP
jgi:protein-tyrosine phosphatase